MVYDGSGGSGARSDVGIRGDQIAAIGDLRNSTAEVDIDASGLAVAPGFINMLSWATESLIQDPRSQSDIRQGVTLEVMGEGDSMGPLSPSMRKLMTELQGDIKYDVSWTTLGEYLTFLEKKGIATNVASFVGATTVRIHELWYADRAPTSDELDRMRVLVRAAMEEGALGVGSSLIYAPAFYAKTDELIALAQEAGRYGGMYISHIRSEGNALLEAVDELIRIAREARVPRRDLSLEGGWRTKLAEAGPGHCPHRSGACRRTPDHRRHVQLPPPRRLASMQRCRRGYRRAACASGFAASRIRLSASASGVR
jgi:N-acyl-D-amino-acid deacylase